MAERTCAACDCQLDTDVIQVKIGGRTVEVCCEDSAHESMPMRSRAFSTCSFITRSSMAMTSTS
jgi:hypothetical protein